MVSLVTYSRLLQLFSLLKLFIIGCKHTFISASIQSTTNRSNQVLGLHFLIIRFTRMYSMSQYRRNYLQHLTFHHNIKLRFFPAHSLLMYINKVIVLNNPSAKPKMHCVLALENTGIHSCCEKHTNWVLF